MKVDATTETREVISGPVTITLSAADAERLWNELYFMDTAVAREVWEHMNEAFNIASNPVKLKIETNGFVMEDRGSNV